MVPNVISHANYQSTHGHEKEKIYKYICNFRYETLDVHSLYFLGGYLYLLERAYPQQLSI